MAKQVGSKKVVMQFIKNEVPNKRDVAEFLFQYVQPNTKFQTDGGGIYKKIEDWWPVKHRVDIHKKFEFGLTSEIEGMFGNLRTFIRRMYHHTTPEYLPDICWEFCVRFSRPEMFDSPLVFLKNTLSPGPLD